MYEEPIGRSVAKVIIVTVLLVLTFLTLIKIFMSNFEEVIRNIDYSTDVNTSILEVYSSNDIYYVNFESFRLMSEKGIDLQFNTYDELKQVLSDFTAKDARDITKELNDCQHDFMLKLK